MTPYKLPNEVLQLTFVLDKPPAGMPPARHTPALEEFFDDLVKWCGERQLFIGGSLETMVIYAPLQPMTSQQQTQLRKRIGTQPGITSWKMEVVWLSSPTALRLKAACMEAFSQAQRYLADRMGESADALAELDPSFNRSWKATLGDAGASLELECWPREIRLSISRVDHTPAPEFSNFVGKTLELQDVEIFIGDWLELHWRQVVHDGDLSVGQWVAECQGWRIHVYGKPTAQLTHRQVMLRLMGAVCAA
jgi:hypothetical protein